MKGKRMPHKFNKEKCEKCDMKDGCPIYAEAFRRFGPNFGMDDEPDVGREQYDEKSTSDVSTLNNILKMLSDIPGIDLASVEEQAREFVETMEKEMGITNEHLPTGTTMNDRMLAIVNTVESMEIARELWESNAQMFDLDNFPGFDFPKNAPFDKTPRVEVVEGEYVLFVGHGAQETHDMTKDGLIHVVARMFTIGAAVKVQMNFDGVVH
jgi:hypothetical protein